MAPIDTPTFSPLIASDTPTIATIRRNPPMTYQRSLQVERRNPPTTRHRRLQAEPPTGGSADAGASGRVARGPPPILEPDFLKTAVRDETLGPDAAPGPRVGQVLAPCVGRDDGAVPPHHQQGDAVLLRVVPRRLGVAGEGEEDPVASRHPPGVAHQARQVLGPHRGEAGQL